MKSSMVCGGGGSDSGCQVSLLRLIPLCKEEILPCVSKGANALTLERFELLQKQIIYSKFDHCLGSRL